MDKAGAEGGSGGGGAEGKSAEASLTDAMRAEIGALISGAFKSEGKRQIASAVKDALEGLKLGDTIAAEVAKLKPEEKPEPKPGEKKPDPEVSALKAKLEELTRAHAQQTEAARVANENARNEKAMASLRAELGPHVRPDALELAARDLFTGQKRVTFDEQGNPLLTVRKSSLLGGEEDVPLPLKDGVAHWLKTEGKFFAPAPNGGGSDPKGGRGPQRGAAPLGRDGLPNYEQPATTDAEKLRRAEERQVAYLARMNTT